jgi:trigger factor
VTKGEGHQVTIKVEAGPEDMEEILERTYKDLSTKVKVPGFRKGKVPRAVIDSHLGVEYVRTEAIKNGLPTLYVLGVIESGIEPVSDPEINVLDLPDDGGVSFEAKVDVKPEIEVKDYKGIEVDKPDTEVTEEDLQRTLDEARDRFATLEVVEGRPVTEGDFVMFDFKVFTDGVPLEGSAGSDRMTEVGAGDFSTSRPTTASALLPASLPRSAPSSRRLSARFCLSSMTAWPKRYRASRPWRSSRRTCASASPRSRRQWASVKPGREW